MRSLLLRLVVLCLPITALAQNTTMLQTTRDRINFSGLQIPNTGVLFGVEGAPGQLLGDGYVDTTFQAGTVLFYGRIGRSDTLAGIPIRLDLMANELEIRTKANTIVVAKGPSIRQFAMNNASGSVSQYVNVREYRGDADAINGFFEQVLPAKELPGKVALLLHPFVSVKKSLYNPALNVGTKDDQLIKKADWYVATNGQATKFSPSKKSVLDLLADKKESIETYLKTEKSDLKSRPGLMAVMAYYNSL